MSGQKSRSTITQRPNLIISRGTITLISTTLCQFLISSFSVIAPTRAAANSKVAGGNRLGRGHKWRAPGADRHTHTEANKNNTCFAVWLARTTNTIFI